MISLTICKNKVTDPYCSVHDAVCEEEDVLSYRWKKLTVKHFSLCHRADPYTACAEERCD